MPNGELDTTALSSWLWDAARKIRGPLDAPKFKDYILPLVFLKRLSDVFEDELDRLAEEFGSRDVATRIVEDERERGTIANSRGSVRFYIPERARWSNIRKQTTGLGQMSPVLNLLVVIASGYEMSHANNILDCANWFCF